VKNCGASEASPIGWMMQAAVIPIRSIALAAAVAIPAALPQHGLLVPGGSLAGVHLGATPAEVRAVWGERFGRCRGCADETWYFTYRAFTPQGAGVAFGGGSAVALFTLWAPPGWQTSRGLRIGDPAVRITALYGALPRIDCGTYAALIERQGEVTTEFYVRDEQVWGFGLSRAAAPACP
jgi:hypothetical protein